MLIQINSDAHVDTSDPFARQVEATLQERLDRFASRISRVEVHLTDVNAHKGGSDDKRCMLEVRIEGSQPTAVTHHAATLQQAVHGALDKLERTLTSTFDKLRDQRR